MNKRLEIISMSDLHINYFLVEGKTSATALHLALFMAGRYSHVELPIVRHSTELRTFTFLILTAHDYNGISSNNCTTVASLLQHGWQGCDLTCLGVVHENIIQFLVITKTTKHNYFIPSSELSPCRSRQTVSLASLYIHFFWDQTPTHYP